MGVSRETSGGEHDDVAVRLGALGLRGQPGGQHLVVHDLALEGGHRLERGLLARRLDRLDRRLGEVDQGRAALGPVTGLTSRVIVPASGAVSPAIMLTSVDLPAPEYPTMATSSPRATDRSMLASTSVRPAPFP